MISFWEEHEKANGNRLMVNRSYTFCQDSVVIISSDITSKTRCLHEFWICWIKQYSDLFNYLNLGTSGIFKVKRVIWQTLVAFPISPYISWTWEIGVKRLFRCRQCHGCGSSSVSLVLLEMLGVPKTNWRLFWVKLLNTSHQFLVKKHT